MPARIVGNRLVISTTMPRRLKLASHLSEGWDAERYRRYVELMHAPGCRSGACRGCA